ncbi:MAG: hypothetical protein R2698_13405 [Microthrixaceae bacterium]
MFLSLADRDKRVGLLAAERFVDLGFDLVATEGTADALVAAGLPVREVLRKLSTSDVPSPDSGEGASYGSGPRRDAVELLESGEVQLVVNSPRGRGPRADGAYIRSTAARVRVPLLTTAAAALAAANGIADTATHEPQVRSLQEYHRGVRASGAGQR